jgi:hypothetical protein
MFSQVRHSKVCLSMVWGCNNNVSVRVSADACQLLAAATAAVVVVHHVVLLVLVTSGAAVDAPASSCTAS